MSTSRRTGTTVRPTLLMLEDRTVPSATLSIADLTVTEGDTATGFLGEFVTAGSGGLDSPRGMAIGPDGLLYVASTNNDSVLRYDANTGASAGTFVFSGSGGLNAPIDLVFGADGHLYVSSAETDEILRYDGPTGNFLGAFVPAGSGGLDRPSDLVFGPDGHLYVSSGNSNEVLRFDGADGSFGGVFVAAGSGGLVSPRGLNFHTDGLLYVADFVGDSVLRYNGATGAFVDVFVPANSGGLDDPSGIAFGPDGNLYVSGDLSYNVLGFDGTTGAPLGEYVAAGDGGVSGPRDLIFRPDGTVLVASRHTDQILRYGPDSQAVLTVTLSEPSAVPVTVNYTTADGTAVAGTDYTATSGTLEFAPGVTSLSVFVPTVDDVAVEPSETVLITLSNAVGATIADDQAVMTITDDDSARLLTVSDATVIEGDTSGHYRGSFASGVEGGHFNPLTFGPDGHLYTAVGTGPGYNTIQRYDGISGAFLGTFVPLGAINGVRDLVFHTDGLLYVASSYTDEVIRYDATTGEFVDVFVSANSGGIDHPDGMAFGPDANSDGVPELYVTGWLSHSVVRYDGATGQPLGTYVTPGAGGLSNPFALAFGPGGVYVTSAGSNQVLKYDSGSGAFLGVAAGDGLDYPRDVAFGPDGLMYVTSGDNDRILRYTAGGTYVDDFVPAGAGGMDNPRSMVFGADGDLFVTATGNTEIFRFGTANEAVLTVSLSEPSELPVTVEFTTADGSAVAGIDYTAVSGTLVFAPGVTSRTILVPILNDADYEGDEAFAVTLSSPSGATITGGIGQVTIQDDEQPPSFTKFYVVDDGGDNTFEYAPDGSLEESYGLASGNSAPRGAATTAAGDTVWVIDSNDYVYVYDTAGTLLRSSKALGLKTPEGIATDGEDVWIVDRGTDRVHFYEGGATRTSNASATSSFRLHSSNKNSYGITTDGTSLWVVDDSNTDRVFKYTVGGTLLGYWQIDSANVQPRGITIDPANVNDVWIVDASTDRVYRYAGAASRTSGSQSAADEFALAPGNSNPQGIADPPPPAQPSTGEGVTVSRTPPGVWLAPPGSSTLTARHTEVTAIADYEPVPAPVRVDSPRANAASVDRTSGPDPVSWGRGDLQGWMELALPVDVDGDREYAAPRPASG